MRLVLEVGSWRLIEDDDGEVRMWHNAESGETRSYDDVPEEVADQLRKQDGPLDPEADPWEGGDAAVSPGGAAGARGAPSGSGGGSGSAGGGAGAGGAGDSEPPRPRPPRPPEGPAAAERRPTLETLRRATTQRPRPGESAAQMLTRVTHLHLLEKGLTVLGDIVFQSCPKLSVLYLSDNRLRELGRLPSTLEALHLQTNELWEMGSWSSDLPRLEVLDIRENRLTLVEGLNRSGRLRELVLCGQGGEGLRFSPSCLRAIAPGLQVLDVARNGLTDLSPLALLPRVERLDASNNALATMAAAAPALRAMQRLQRLRLEGNPLCFAAGGRRYRDEAVLLAEQLCELDGREVRSSEHAFLGELEKRRRSRAGGRRNPSAPPQLQSSTSAPLAGGGGAGAAGSPASGTGGTPRGRGSSSGRLQRASSATPPTHGCAPAPLRRGVRRVVYEASGPGGGADTASFPGLPPLPRKVVPRRLAGTAAAATAGSCVDLRCVGIPSTAARST